MNAIHYTEVSGFQVIFPPLIYDLVFMVLASSSGHIRVSVPSIAGSYVGGTSVEVKKHTNHCDYELWLSDINR